MTNQEEILHEFTKDADENSVEIIKALAELILSDSRNFSMAIKWKQLTFTLNDDFHHWICAVARVKKGINLVFHFGGLLDDKFSIFKAGTSKFFRKIEINSIEDMDPKVIMDYVGQAAEKLQFFKDNWKEINKKD